MRTSVVLSLVFLELGCGKSDSNYGSGGGGGTMNVPAGTTTFTVSTPNAPTSYTINNFSVARPTPST